MKSAQQKAGERGASKAIKYHGKVLDMLGRKMNQLDKLYRQIEGLKTTTNKVAERYNPVPGRKVVVGIYDAQWLISHKNGYNEAVNDVLKLIKEAK